MEMDPLELNGKPIDQKTDIAGTAERQKKDDLQKLKKACKDFETIFTYQLLKTMRKTVPKTSGMGNFFGNDMYNMIADQKVAEELSGRGNGLGLQKMLFEQLTKNIAGEVPNQKVKQD
jgi:peptidoglycan hydrolase FlgJ